MRKVTTGLLAAAAAAALASTAMQGSAAASPPPAHAGAGVKTAKNHKDDMVDAKEANRRANRKAALQKVLHGNAKAHRRGDSKVVKVGDEYAEVKSARTDRIFSILCQFGDKTDPRTGGSAGPEHNQIAKPDRKRDNSTYWQKDFSTQHYKDMFFAQGQESFADFYLKQSQGQYTVTGDVSNWVTVPYNEARYGSNKISESDGYWNFVKDCTTAWYDKQKAMGKSKAEIQEYLNQFDKWDRYDYDDDGNFDEPDGYVDHIFFIHAGEGEEAGGGAQGDDAIWSHRWAAFPSKPVGPDSNKSGGVQVGDTGLWVRDYTTEPENGGLGVFAHEYGNDLGLPDEYDTAGGENGTGFWTLMSSGSWLNHGKESIGTTPGYMNAWDKLQLGWLDYAVTTPNRKSKHTVGVAERDTKNPQALVVVLPQKEVVTHYNKPFAGKHEWWGGSADNLDTSISRTLDLTGKKSAKVDAKAWYKIEKTYDNGFLEVSTDDGETWKQVGDPITGSSGGKWTDVSYDLSKYAGKKVQVRFHYVTDGGVHHDGLFLDDIAITVDGKKVFTDGAEDGDNGWTVDGFKRMTGTTDEMKGQYYIAENRQYVDYDKTLKQGPYNFGYANSKPNWVDHFPYQNGLVVWFWDETQEDNNTSQHPGKGLILPVDSHSKPFAYTDGKLVDNRKQPFDATFGKQKTDPVQFVREVKQGGHWQVTVADVPSHRAKRTFNDSNPNRYWSKKNPQNSVKVAGVGVKIKVQKVGKNGKTMTLKVKPTN